MTDINNNKHKHNEPPSKKTLGQQLYETHEEHKKASPVESGDLVNSFGKDYMKELEDVICKHAHLRYKYYIQVISKHLIYAPTRGLHLIFFVRKTRPKKEHTQDVWSVDNRYNFLKLEWSLPHIYEMKNFIRSPELYDKKIVHDIQDYLKENKIDLTKIQGVRVI